MDLDDLIDLARTLLGDPPPIRDLGLLGSAAARPQATAFGQDAYPDLVTKAAALLQSIVNNHALVDGNKRLGWLAAAVFLELNGVKPRGPPTTPSMSLSSGSPRPTLISTTLFIVCAASHSLVAGTRRDATRAVQTADLGGRLWVAATGTVLQPNPPGPE